MSIMKKGIMKKRVYLTGVLALLTAFMAACGASGNEAGSGAQGETASVAAEASGIASEEAPEQAVLEETDASEFTYTEVDGTITIKSYTGTATEVVIPSLIDGKEVTVIGESCFMFNDELTKVVCPDTLLTISENAFFECTSLSEVVLNDGLQTLGIRAFAFCINLTEIYIPDSVTSLEDSVFILSGLTEVNFPPLVSELPDGCFAGTDFTSITIPSHIKSIGYEAFESCANLETVVIEEGVEMIGEGAFAQCDVLKEINIPASVTEIGESLFWASNDELVVTVLPGSVGEEYVIEYSQYKEFTYVNP